MSTRSFQACLLAVALVTAGVLPAAAAAAATTAVLTLAEQPLRLIRGATLYKAAAGVAIQKDDILETGAAGAQVEAGPQAIVALGPHTRVLVLGLAGDDKSGTELALLDGWAKVLAKTAGKRAAVATPALQVLVAAGSTIVRGGSGKDAVFAEEGEQLVARVDANGKAGAPLKLPAEQFAAVDPAKPQPLAGRPPRAFVAEMPPAFRDGLARVPNVANAGKVAPVKERDADFSDVEAWLGAPPQLRRNFAARFKPRLADPVFRKQVERAFGASADWKAVLQPQSQSRSDPKRRADQTLF